MMVSNYTGALTGLHQALVLQHTDVRVPISMPALSLHQVNAQDLANSATLLIIMRVSGVAGPRGVAAV